VVPYILKKLLERKKQKEEDKTKAGISLPAQK